MSWIKRKLNQLSDFIDKQQAVHPVRAAAVEGAAAIILSIIVLIVMVVGLALTA